MKKNKFLDYSNVAIILITLLAGFLRFYRLPNIMPLDSEQGHNYLAIKNIVDRRQLPLLGPPTSHPWLSFGPLFYYLMIPIMTLAGSNPLAPAYFFALIYTAIVPLNYIVINRFLGRKTALISSLLIAVSPLWLQFSRAARFYCLVPFLLYFFIWELANVVKSGKGIFWLGLILGIIFNFHLTPLVLLPAVITLFWFKRYKWLKNKKQVFRIALKGFFGLLIPLCPIVIYDLTHQFKMTTKFLLWIPYRLAGFAHLYPKNNLTLDSFKQTSLQFFNFIHLSLFPKTFPWQISLSFFVIITAAIILSRKSLFKKSFFSSFMLLLAFWGTISLFVHSDPPLHYFLPLFPLPAIILGQLFVQLSNKPTGKKLTVGFILILALIAFKYYFSPSWFFKSESEVELESHYVPYRLQRKIIWSILNDSKDKPFSLSRIGPYDNFENTFSDNYRYLASWLGHPATTKEKAQNDYVIIEDLNKIPKALGQNQIMFEISNFAILKTSRL